MANYWPSILCLQCNLVIRTLGKEQGCTNLNPHTKIICILFGLNKYIICILNCFYWAIQYQLLNYDTLFVCSNCVDMDCIAPVFKINRKTFFFIDSSKTQDCYSHPNILKQLSLNKSISESDILTYEHIWNLALIYCISRLHWANRIWRLSCMFL